MPQYWFYLLVVWSVGALAYSENEDVIVKNVIAEAKAKQYRADEIKWAVRSNTFDVPDIILCAYVPSLEECYQ